MGRQQNEMLISVRPPSNWQPEKRMHWGSYITGVRTDCIKPRYRQFSELLLAVPVCLVVRSLRNLGCLLDMLGRNPS
ncbi:hypothetical protein M404DRAFT_993473 [Pisolithus tinctorius Marx 270]|uniref:Uncharacterized protein n=1 Tax=Pisolithus tinctorius Marx 270 TaxID=870435 RepID=A0A0C3JTL4_PISTI|nr:hypothetical protein M404DRAFT_993473 [Pisolithus tinctorius Marx 270]